jgi:hypothetical protein
VLLVEGMLHLDRGETELAERSYRDAVRLTATPSPSPRRRLLRIQTHAARGSLRREQGK